MRFLVILLLAVAATSCDIDKLLYPSIPAEATPFAALPIYHEWWEDVQRDAGHTGPLRPLDVQWYKVPGPYWITGRGDEARGAWIPGGRIYIAEPVIECPEIVKHELLHHYLQGDSGHKHPLFATDAYSGICESDYD